MYTVEKLEGDKLREFARIALNAYPSNQMPQSELEESLIKRNERDDIEFYGLYSEDTLVGGMRFHDFRMNLLQQKVKVGGIGSVAVDLSYKKEKVAKSLLEYFLNYYKEKGYSLATLHSFNPSFYKKMGFGFGSTLNQFKLKPNAFPSGESKKNIKHITIEDIKELCEFYNSQVEKINGLFEKSIADFEMMFKDSSNKIYGYKKDNKILGYVVFSFKRGEGSFLVNDMVVSEILFEDSQVFMELMTFLNSQNDQIRYIIFNIHDENFMFSLKDPRNNSENILTSVIHECSLQGTGTMYRVLSVEKLFEDLKKHNFNNQTCTIKLTLTDTFIRENEGSYIIEFKNGIATYKEDGECDVEISMDISEFASLITCSVDLKSLYRYGLVKLSDEKYLSVVNSIFDTDNKPQCLTMF